MSRPRPDLLVPYRPHGDDLALDSAEGTAYALIYVRPETNRVSYEGEILKAVRGRAEIAYMANLNGRLFTEDGILPAHYSSQFRFAAFPDACMADYPEVAAAFERHFGLPSSEADIVGSLGAVARGLFTDEELFNDIVPGSDFLTAFGQTFKRVDGHFVVNYDLPAIMRRYTPEANCFCCLVRAREAGADFYVDLNRAIYEELISRPETPLVMGDKFEGLPWSERVRRTYHVSSNRLMAMLDMADFVYLDEANRLDVASTPLGQAITAGGSLDAKTLRALKERHLCRILPPGTDPGALVYLPQAFASRGATPGSAAGAALGATAIAEGVEGLMRKCAAYL